MRAVLRRVVAIALGGCLLLVTGATLAAPDPARELRRAQQALAAGEYDRAYPEYLRYAEQGNALAQFTVALFYELGWGRPVDAAKACAWFEQSVEGAIPAGAYYHARCLDQGTRAEAEPAAAAEWYAKAAQYGHKASLCSLGEMYMQGRGVEKNPRRAIELCRQAGAEGVPSALLTVGEFHLTGDESVRDPQAAFIAFQQAASMGAAEGFYRLDRMAESGIAPAGVDEHVRQHWREQAAARGHAQAYLATGEGFWNRPDDSESGKPAADDLAKAYLWLKAAAQAAPDADERERAKALLTEVREIMPPTWAPDLDAKVAAHLETFPPASP